MTESGTSRAGPGRTVAAGGAAALLVIAALAVGPAPGTPATGRTTRAAPQAAVPDTSAAATVVGDTAVVYRREVFDYPAGGRRNPFDPMDTGETSGPRLADLTLTGILYSPDSGSVVVLVDPGTGRRYRLRAGDRVGKARLVEVAPGRAVFRVEAFGFDRRTVLRLEQDEEGSP